MGMLGFDFPFTLRLSTFVALSPNDRIVLNRAASWPVRAVSARRDILLEGERPRAAVVVLEGWAISYKMLRDGRRQIVGFHLPGDLCFAAHGLQTQVDHSLAALTPVRLAEINLARLEQMASTSPRIAEAMWGNELQAAMIQREWMTNLGQRTARERIAHMLCELHARLAVVGLAEVGSFAFHARQVDLAEAAGISAVHVNRMLRRLRADGLIEFRDRRLFIHDLPRLAGAGLFDPAYLHLGRKKIPRRQTEPLDRGISSEHVKTPQFGVGFGPN